MSLIVLLVMYNLHFLDLLLLRFESDEGDAGGRTLIWVPRLNAFFCEGDLIQWLFGVGRDKSLVLGTGSVEGFYNMAIGNAALYSNTTGSYNTASGHQALYNNTSGHNNTANRL